jgi:ZIP family zinc transporter
MDALAAGFWGFVGGASLLIGALMGLYVGVPQRVTAIIAAAGAGVLVSSVAFELMEEAYRTGGFYAASIGILLGALALFTADWAVCYIGGKHRKRSGGQQAGGSSTAITIGAILDGIPESVAIGVSLIEGAVMVVAVLLSNVPESLSAASGTKKAGHTPTYILGLWATVVAMCALSALFGYLFLAGAPEELIAAILAFATGAILTMLASTMFPEAYEEGGHVVGVVTTIGFLVAFVLSRLE